MIKLKSTYQQTFIYGLGNIAVKAFGFFILPVYTANLDNDSFGRLILLEVMAQFFVGMMSLNIPLAMLRLVSEPSEQKVKGRIYFTAGVILLISILAIFLILILSRSYLAEVVLGSSDYSHYIFLLSIAVAIEIFSLLPLQLLRHEEKALNYTLISLVKLSIMFCSVYYLIAVQKLGVEGYLYSIILGNLSVIILTIPAQLRFSVPKMDFQIARDMVSYGAPLALTTVSALILSFGDRFIIKLYTNLESVAIYGLAWKLGSMINVLLLNSYSQGFIPIAFKKYGTAGFKSFFQSQFSVFCFVLLATTLGLSLFSKELVWLASSGKGQYEAAVWLTALIAFAFVFKGFHFFLNITFYILKTTRISAAITVMGMLINLALNFLLIPTFGAYGAVAATMVCFVIMAAMTYRISSQKLDIKYNLNQIGVLIVLTVSFATAGLFINYTYWVTTVFLKLCIFTGYVMVVFIFVLNKSERSKVKHQYTIIRKRIYGLLQLD